MIYFLYMLKSLSNKIAWLKACNFIRKKLHHREIFKNACSEEHLGTTASAYLKSRLQIMQFTHKPCGLWDFVDIK